MNDCKEQFTAGYKNSPLHMTTCYGIFYDSELRCCHVFLMKNFFLVVRPGPVTCRAKGVVTNYGRRGLQNWRGGVQVKFYPLQKGGAEKVLAMLKG